jgi:hypothetical protein
LLLIDTYHFPVLGMKENKRPDDQRMQVPEVFLLPAIME